MTYTNKISSVQLLCLFSLSRGILSIAYGAFSESGNLQSACISAIISGLFSLLIAIPGLYIGNSARTMLNNTSGKIISGFYALYFFYSICVTLTMFTLMRAETLGAGIPVIILPIIMVIVTLYGAYKGIEAIARTSTLILFAIVTAFLLLCISLFQKSDILNLMPISSMKIADILNDSAIMIGEQSCIPAIIFIYPHIKGNVRKTVGLWILVVFIFIASLSLFVASILGDYSFTQNFPVYSWARLTSFGVMQRLDAIFSAIWTAGIFVRLSLLFWVMSISVRYTFGKKLSKIFTLFLSVAALAISINTPFNESIRKFVLNGSVLLIVTASCSIILPVALIIKKKVNR